MDTLAELELTTVKLHEDINNFERQGEINRLKGVVKNIETRKAIGTALRSRIK